MAVWHCNLNFNLTKQTPIVRKFWLKTVSMFQQKELSECWFRLQEDVHTLLSHSPYLLNLFSQHLVAAAVVAVFKQERNSFRKENGVYSFHAICPFIRDILLRHFHSQIKNIKARRPLAIFSFHSCCSQSERTESPGTYKGVNKEANPQEIHFSQTLSLCLKFVTLEPFFRGNLNVCTEV